jgi:hypothetical protein
VTEEFGTTLASIKCAVHGQAAGGAALVVDSCPSADIDVTFRLVGRTLLDGGLPTPPAPTDAGADSGSAADADAGSQPDADAAVDAAPADAAL